jgi:pimeloyl-ACP methyl ester carboxylesterase
MNMHVRNVPQAPDATVVAIHCSGADGQQWHKLGQRLDPDGKLVAVNLYGTRATGHWSGEEPFTMADEARPILAVIDALQGPIHLVGHSYGGAVALYVALQRIGRIASLALYEPSTFHMLKQMGPQGVSAHGEIAAIRDAAVNGIASGDQAAGAATCIDYWSGPGAWAAMKPETRASVLAWFAKAPLDFQAAIGDQTSLGDYRQLHCPVLVMRGAHALLPSRLMAEGVACLVPYSRLVVVPGAGHMGPLTHSEAVNGMIIRHIEAAGAVMHSRAEAMASAA